MRRFTRKLLLALLGALTLTALTAQANEAFIRKTLEARVQGIKIDGVVKTPYLGLWEVRVGEELLYTDDKVSYIFSGSVLDGRNMKNLTEERLQKLTAIKFDDLPLAQAVKVVRGNGRRQLAVFEDPNCGFCKRFEQDLAKLDDVTVYVFLYPILSQNSVDKSKAVWCAPDRAKAWNDMMLSNNTPTLARNCDNPVEKNLELGRKMRIDGTPTTFLPSGERIVGARFNDIKVALDAAAK
ncbi:MAG: DsbC family protein [Betaproteobacteria bacterium]